MDRTRRANLSRDRRRGELKRILGFFLAAAACTEFTGDFSDIIALEYTGPTSPSVEEGDTVRLTARALDIRGDTLPDAEIVWRVIELDTVDVGFVLDSVTGLIAGVHPGGPWRVQGSAEGLQIDPPISVRVTAAPDSAARADTGAVVMSVAQNQTSSLTVAVFDLTTTPDQPGPAGGARVRYQLVDPEPGSAQANGIAIVVTAEVGDDPHAAETESNSAGQAAAFVRRVGTSQPDSVLIDAVVFTARGDTVPGSPIRFLVLIESN